MPALTHGGQIQPLYHCDQQHLNWARQASAEVEMVNGRVERSTRRNGEEGHKVDSEFFWQI